MPARGTAVEGREMGDDDGGCTVGPPDNPDPAPRDTGGLTDGVLGVDTGAEPPETMLGSRVDGRVVNGRSEMLPGLLLGEAVTGGRA